MRRAPCGGNLYRGLNSTGSVQRSICRDDFRQRDKLVVCGFVERKTGLFVTDNLLTW